MFWGLCAGLLCLFAGQPVIAIIAFVIVSLLCRKKKEPKVFVLVDDD